MVSVTIRMGQSPSADQSVCEVGVRCTLKRELTFYSFSKKLQSSKKRKPISLSVSQALKLTLPNSQNASEKNMY